MKIPTYKEISKTLKNLLSDFKDETNENTEWVFGDEGSWTDNIKDSENLLKKLKGLNSTLPLTITDLYPARDYPSRYNTRAEVQGINGPMTFESLGMVTLEELKDKTGISIKDLKKLIRK